MIKLFTTQKSLEGRFVVAIKKRAKSDDIEGYFCTMADLRELVEFARRAFRGSYDAELDLDQWLASKGVKGE